MCLPSAQSPECVRATCRTVHIIFAVPCWKRVYDCADVSRLETSTVFSPEVPTKETGFQHGSSSIVTLSDNSSAHVTTSDAIARTLNSETNNHPSTSVSVSAFESEGKGYTTPEDTTDDYSVTEFYSISPSPSTHGHIPAAITTAPTTVNQQTGVKSQDNNPGHNGHDDQDITTAPTLASLSTTEVTELVEAESSASITGVSGDRGDLGDETDHCQGRDSLSMCMFTATTGKSDLMSLSATESSTQMPTARSPAEETSTTQMLPIKSLPNVKTSTASKPDDHMLEFKCDHGSFDGELNNRGHRAVSIRGPRV